MHIKEQRKLRQDKLVLASSKTADELRMVGEKDSSMMAGIVIDSDMVTLRNGSMHRAAGYDNAVCNVDDESEHGRLNDGGVERLYPHTIKIVKEMPALHLEHCKL